jgi:hypothetical protein
MKKEYSMKSPETNIEMEKIISKGQITIPQEISEKREQRLQRLFASGERIAAQGNFTEDDVMEEINQYRKNK